MNKTVTDDNIGRFWVKIQSFSVSQGNEKKLYQEIKLSMRGQKRLMRFVILEHMFLW